MNKSMNQMNHNDVLLFLQQPHRTCRQQLWLRQQLKQPWLRRLWINRRQQLTVTQPHLQVKSLTDFNC